MKRTTFETVGAALLFCFTGCSCQMSRLDVVDMSRNSDFQDYVGRNDELCRDCYLCQGRLGYEILDHLDDDKKFIVELKKGTKVSVVRVERVSETRSGRPRPEAPVPATQLIPILVLDGSANLDRSEPIAARFEYLKGAYR